MILINTQAIEGFIKKHADAQKSLRAWMKTAADADWKHLVDVGKNFPSADGVKVSRGIEEVVFTVFNINGNRYRLVARINYENQIVDIHVILTHAQYDRNKWKSV